jgi:uncharacterized membrane protein YjjP (DUF1212 family)
MSSATPEIEFLVELGRSLQAYGLPAHRFEEALGGVARSLGLEAQFFALPTGFMAWLRLGDRQQSLFLRSDNGATDLAKLSTLMEITDRVMAGQLSATEASRQLRVALAAPPRWNDLWMTVAYGLASGAFASFFQASLRDALAGVALGVALGVMVAKAATRPRFANLVPTLGALLVSTLAVTSARLGFGTSTPVVTLAGLILLIPGLAVVVAMNELGTGNLVSGTSRLTGAAMVFLQLAFGTALGQRIGATWAATPVVESPPLPGWFLYVALVIVPLTCVVLFQARARDAGWIAIACWIAFAGARGGAALLGPEFGAGVGAWVLGSFSNAVARFFNRPALMPLLPGLLLLVPGSLGYRSLGYLMTGDTAAGIAAAVQLAFVAVALLVGLLLSRVTVEPNRPL